MITRRSTTLSIPVPAHRFGLKIPISMRKKRRRSEGKIIQNVYLHTKLGSTYEEGRLYSMTKKKNERTNRDQASEDGHIVVASTYYLSVFFS